MSEGLSDSETQVGENSVGDWLESDSAPTAAINGFGNPDGPMSRGIKRPRDFLGMRFYPRTTEVYEQNVGLGQQQQQLGEPSWEVRNNVAVDDRNISTNIPYEGPNPQQVEGHGSDSASSFMNGYGRSDSSRATDILMSVSVSTDFTKIKILEFANSAMEDLITMSKKDFNPFDYRHADRMRTAGFGNNQSLPCSGYLHLEASRETAYVGMNRLGIVEMLMDSNRWAAKFADIVSRAILLAVINPGTAEYDGALQVMTAEFHIPTPLVPVRDSYFARYCRKLSPDTWGVVDISLESLFPYPASTRYRRKPSGCLIHELPNGCSKIIWLEYVEADNGLVHKIFQHVVCSGYVFGAQRWVVAIAREHDLLQALMNMTPSEGALRITPMGRVSLLKLVEKMTREFFLDASGSSTNMWMTLPLHGNEDIKITVKNRAHSFGFLGGRTIVLSTSVEIPVPPKRVFSLLSAAESRPKWDFLSQSHVIRELANIIVGSNPESRVSILEIINTTPENTDAPMFYLQKSYIDPTFAYVVYAPIDVPAMSMLLSGGDPESVAFMTSGFMMFPDRPILPGEESSGSLLTVLFHILDDAPREDHYCLSLNSLNVSHSLISGTVGMIKDNFIRGHQRSGGRRGN
ncbi:homeobox-leucine zipper protein HDG2-like [Punica granatum]|uniref:Homeobox-leucine zipper protein HDG2-like n=1 Tax=Punica granatum TaxID=22663 RepID=A0A6P8CEM7_PUNGR|nr:homeobox-leucine zipper protein HDG2-like [Punica granatum]